MLRYARFGSTPVILQEKKLKIGWKHATHKCPLELYMYWCVKIQIAYLERNLRFSSVKDQSLSTKSGSIKRVIRDSQVLAKLSIKQD